MKKSQRLDIVCAVFLFALINSANAAIVASDDTTITSADQSYAQALAVPPLSFPGVALTINVPGESGQTQPDKDFNYVINGASAGSLHPDSHINLWLLLIAASVLGLLSEIFHRRSANR
jgi:hypothetical protein